MQIYQKRSDSKISADNRLSTFVKEGYCEKDLWFYTPGLIHAKSYIADDKYAMIGTINLDYRSLVHHFKNGV